jgi:katanin p60 ATPase-containing subunit A1
MSLSGLMSKGDYESRQKVEKKENERKKNILILIHQYLMNIGFGDTAIKLEEESNLELETYIVADNMDLYMILREYEDYYYMKFGRNPKFVQKISDGKMGGPLPKINGRNVNNKNQVPRKRGSQTPSNQNQQNNKHIDVTNLKNNNNSQNTNNISNSTTTNTNNTNNEIKLELNINSFNPKNNSQRVSYPNNKKNPNQQQQEDKYSFNDHKESILLKPLPSDLPDDMRDLAILIKREIILENPNVTFNDIIGLDTPKKIIEEALLWPIKYPQFFTGLLDPWKGILLFGPPGTGKTLLAKAVATEMRTTFFNISAATVVSKWRGDSEKIIKVLFDLARHYQPSTIFLDEIDSIMSARGSSQDEHEGSRRMKTELLIQLDGLTKNEGVFLLAASNTPWDLDPALLRRLEKRVMVSLPDEAGREFMIKTFIPENIMKGINYKECAKGLDGYSGSDIKLLCKEAIMMRTRKAIQIIESDKKGKMFSIRDFPVTKEDFEESVKKVKPAYTYKTEMYINWMKEYGSA